MAGRGVQVNPSGSASAPSLQMVSCPTQKYRVNYVKKGANST